MSASHFIPSYAFASCAPSYMPLKHCFCCTAHSRRLTGPLPAAAEAEESGEEGSESWSDKFSNLLTSTYGELQAAAGKAVGVPQGEAWRTALRAAARCGTAQVCCGPCPAPECGTSAGVWGICLI